MPQAPALSGRTQCRFIVSPGFVFIVIDVSLRTNGIMAFTRR